MSRIKSAFWGSLSSQVYMIISLALSMVTIPIFLKFLNKEEYGLYTILFQVIGYLSIFDFGLGSAITRYLAANPGKDEEAELAVNKVISTSFFTYSILGLLVVAVGIYFSVHVPTLFNVSKNLSSLAITIFFTLSVFVGIQFPVKVFSSIFYAHQKQLLSNTVTLVLSFINFGLRVVFLYFNQGLWSFVYTNVISSIVSIIITFLLIRKYYPNLRVTFKLFDKALLSQMFHFGFFVFIGGIATQVVFYTDRFFIGALVSLSAVSVFTLTAKASEICRDLIFKITDNVYPALVEISFKEKKEKLKQVHAKLLLITVCFVVIAFWMVLILNYWFLKLWVGEEFFAGTTTLLLTLMLMIRHNIIHVSALFLFGAGIVKGISFVAIIDAALNIALTIILGKAFGTNGIILASLLAGLLTTFWYIPYKVSKYLQMNFKEYFLKPILLPFIIINLFGILMYWVMYQLFQIISVNWWSFLFLAFFLCIAFCVFVWVSFLRKEVGEYIPNKLRKYLLIP